MVFEPGGNPIRHIAARAARNFHVVIPGQEYQRFVFGCQVVVNRMGVDWKYADIVHALHDERWNANPLQVRNGATLRVFEAPHR